MVILYPFAMLLGAMFTKGNHIPSKTLYSVGLVAIVALLLRAPFIVVVVLAAFTAAVLRLLGWHRPRTGCDRTYS